ncbi:IS110 family transposase [Flavobacterium humidisoli]|uniref:IS110 family transposase n=1 Tax=Flavobacterium humidisoli TaxID=2937442 RepID=A0ABY4LPT5_9FLAO|nr:IS110 family transposase [Flavobacterium humidisoli]UPZ13636.1 IS110 family transposase [Flavobacterium humidisoli]UPZ14293.1 IS110 family transposase [Flavobacterium humidisoli]UPZ14927.1 IS110 family transposase [Flavobacterium humidisoli]
MKNIIVGIDISSKTLDICVKEESVNYFSIENNVQVIKRFFKRYSDENVIIGMENTGRYNWNLFEVLEKFNFRVYVISALHIKKSIGLVRGKNDKIDALRICNFIEKNYQENREWKPSSRSIKKIKILLTERALRIKIKKQLMAQQHDYKLMKGIGLDKELKSLNVKLIKSVEEQIKAIENDIEKVIHDDQSLSQKQKLIKSVPGVGQVLSWTLLSKTEGFTVITDPRKMACYSGVVPFDFQSGTSLKRRPRVSMLADKGLKTILHLAAMSAIRLDNDLSKYYHRKIDEGKNKMSVLNAVRNKIIHRVFAVIKKQIPYQKDLVLS